MSIGYVLHHLMAHAPEAVLVCAVQIFPFFPRVTRHLIPSLGDDNKLFFQCHLGLVSVKELAAGFQKEGARSKRQFGNVT